MRIDLTGDEAAMLKGLLADCILGLKREIARTEHHGFRHELVQREELCESLIARLDADQSRTSSASAPAS
jgi:hypothetical protein